MRYSVWTIIFCLFVGIGSVPHVAAQDNNAKSEQVLEARAKEVGRSLRCVVCQNQSIEESDASLAEDMRRLVRARIDAGDSNAEVIAYMQSRYGDFVLLEPPIQSNTYALWALPFVLLTAALFWFSRQTKRHKQT